MPRERQQSFRGRLLALAAAGASLLLAGWGEPASGEAPFVTNIAAEMVSISCESGGRAAGRVRIAAQVGYSDVAPELVPELRGRRQRGSVSVTLMTSAGRTLARARDTAALDLAAPRDRVYQTYTALLERDASKRVLRYAHGTSRCGGTPERDLQLDVLVRARQVLPAVGTRGKTARQTTHWRAQASVVSAGATPASTCPPYPCFGTAADLLAWNLSSARPFDRSNVPLAERVASPVPRMLVGFDNGPWSFWSDFDLNAQGSAATGNVYNFSHWQYVDSFYYYLHQLVSIPPTVWINAAHRNGVTALGTVTEDCDGCGDEMKKLFEEHGPQAVEQLRLLAATYGFDGWLIDVEGAGASPALLAAMQQLAAQTLPDGARVQVIYYQAFEYHLDGETYGGLQAAGSWQSDYTYTGADTAPEGTYSFLAGLTPPATDVRYDAYWASDMFRPPYEQPASVCGGMTSGDYLFNGQECNDVATLFANQGSARAPTDPPAFYQSLALFAPDWTMYGGLNQTTDPRSPREVFQAVEEQLWAGTGGYHLSAGHCMLAQPGQNSVSSLVEPRSVLTKVPFFTRFNTGEGSDFFVEGRATSAGNWNLLGAQDPVPMEVCSDGNTAALPPGTMPLGADIAYDDAYDGGSSLRVWGTATADSRRLYLYEANAPLPQRPAFTLRYRLPTGGAATPVPHVVVWIEGMGPIDLQPVSTTTAGEWVATQSQLPALLAGTLTRIGIGFDVSSSQHVDVLIGELGVVDLASYEPPAQITPSPPSGSTLAWTDPTASTTQYYNVWAVRGGSCAQLVGRSMLPLYDLDHPLFAIPDGGEQFIVQPVSTSGLAAPLSIPPC